MGNQIDTHIVEQCSFPQQGNLKKNINHRKSQNNSRNSHRSHRGGQKKNMNEFFKICGEFEHALKTVTVNKRAKSSVHQKLQNIHKVLVEKMATLDKTNKKDSSNLSSHNKSLSLSTSSVCSKQSSKELSNLSSHQEFFKGVNCPFCDECQLDKCHLINHLDEDCLQFKMKSLKKETNLPYSLFQILPNNWFKCNVCPNMVVRDLQHYLYHLNCSSHEISKKKMGSKSYTDSFFCSICKLLVPNNFTELNMHLEHEQHMKRSNKFVNDRIFHEKKISCICFINGEYYCFACSRKFTKGKNLMDFMHHLTGDNHKRNLEKHSIKATKAYCQFCEKELNTFEIWDHFRSLEHESKILEQKFAQYYTLCVYCSSDFSDLTALLNHMKGGCKEMEILRKGGLTSDREASGKSTKMEKGVSGNPEVKDGHCLFIHVSDDLVEDVSDWKKFFENFGRVISVYNLTAGKFMIVFDERDTVNKILDYKDSLGFNNKIIAVSETLSGIVENEPNQSESESENENESDEENYRSDVDSLSSDGEMKNLFQEAGIHLLKKIETMDSAEDDEILLISQMTLKATMTFSGFRGCQLLLPNETRLNLHCRFEAQVYNSVIEDLGLKQQVMSNEMDSKRINFALSKVALELMDKSPFWEQAQCIPTSISYVKCIHKRTGKSCIITFSESDKELTDALSACLKENDFIKPFLLTLKLWLSSQETFLSDVEYPVIAVVLFFLTSKSLVRPFSVPEHPIHFKILRNCTQDGHDLKATKPVDSIAEENVSDLFQMFLEFLNTFDFEKYAICFPLPRPVPRTMLGNMLNVTGYGMSNIWIMNTRCTWNYTADVQGRELKSFLSLVNKTLQEI